MTPTTTRIDLIDALRGFAIVSIMLLHNIEHFDLYHIPSGMPAWLMALDKVVWNSAFFLFGGKSYAIFALLFGVTFTIQMHGREKRGEDFRPRYAWRMVLLLGFGLINSMFYHGDILSIYAVLGLLLIPVARMRDGAVLLIAGILMLQPYQWWEFIQAWPHPEIKLDDPASWAYFGRASDYMKHGTPMEVWAGNLTNGKVGVIMWSWENGRIFQIPALFMLGILAGRRDVFSASVENTQFWKKVLLISGVLFLPLFGAHFHMRDWGIAVGLERPLNIIVTSWSNLSFMLVLVSSFTLLYQSGCLSRLASLFIPLGRMSLSSYVLQSVVGTAIYYGFGGGLYQYTGATACLLIGVILAILQSRFSAWWLRTHAQGPLEMLWHRATWAGRA